MKNKIIVLLAVLSALSIISCEDGEPDTIATRIMTLEIVNDTQETLYVDGYSREEYIWLDHYFDTVPINDRWVYKTYKIPAKENKEIDVFNYTLKECRDDNTNVWIKVVRQSTVENHSIEEIREKNINDGIYKYTLSELKKKKGVHGIIVIGDRGSFQR